MTSRTDTDLSAWEAFVEVAHSGSFTIAADILGVDVGFLSRKIDRLEKCVHLELLSRDKRPLVPTESGRELLPECEKMLLAYRSIMDRAAAENRDLSGLVRVMLPTTLAGHFLAALKPEFLGLYPHIAFELNSPVELDDLIRNRVDVAAVQKGMPLGDLITLPRGRMVTVPVASSEFLSRHGPVDSLHDPDQVPVFLTKRAGFDEDGAILLQKKGRRVRHTIAKPSICNNAIIIRDAALQGLGVALNVPLFACIDDIAEKRLVPVLSGWRRPEFDLFVACSRRSWLVRRNRIFALWLARRLDDHVLEVRRRFEALYPGWLGLADGK